MKKKKWLKWLLIILMVCIISSTGIVALAEVKFGDWNRWDKSLPPWDHKSWVWEGETCCSRIISFPPSEDTPVWVWRDHWKITTITYPPIVKDVFSLFLVRLSFLENKHQASVIFLLPADKNVDKDIKDNFVNAEFALVVFPPKKGKITVRVYENKNGLFQFLEKWTELFKNEIIIFPEKATEFAQRYEDWFDNQFERQDIEETTRQWLERVRIRPRLIILDTESFFISIAPASIDRRAPTLFFY